MSTTLTAGNQYKAILSMSLPMLAVVTLLFWVGIVDIYVAGKIGKEVQAVIGFCVQVYFISSIIANAIGVGTVSMVSQLIGASQRQEAVAVARQSVALAFVTAVVMAVAVYLLSQYLADLIDVQEDFKATATSLLQIYAITISANYIILVCNAVFRASAEVGKYLFCMFAVGVTNMFFCFALALGMFGFSASGALGIAYASMIAHCIGALVSLLFLGTSKWEGFYSFKNCHFDKSVINRLFSLAWPSAILQFAWHGGSLVVFYILSRLPSEEAIVAMASLTNGMRIEAVIYLPAFAFNMSASTLIGQNLGAGNIKRAFNIGYKIASLAGIVVIVMSVVIYIFAYDIATAISTEGQVIAETVRYLYYNLLVEPFMAVGVVLAGAMQGAGDTKGVMKVIAFCMWFVRLPLSWLLCLTLQLGAQGVWLAMIISMALQGSLLFWRFHRGLWLKGKTI